MQITLHLCIHTQRAGIRVGSLTRACTCACDSLIPAGSSGRSAQGVVGGLVGVGVGVGVGRLTRVTCVADVLVTWGK